MNALNVNQDKSVIYVAPKKGTRAVRMAILTGLKHAQVGKWVQMEIFIVAVAGGKIEVVYKKSPSLEGPFYRMFKN